MERITVIRRMQKDLDWLYSTARDKGEKEAISFVEDVIDNWVDSELKLQIQDGDEL